LPRRPQLSTASRGVGNASGTESDERDSGVVRISSNMPEMTIVSRPARGFEMFYRNHERDLSDPSWKPVMGKSQRAFGVV